MSRLQLLTTKFESLKILKDETIVEFNVCLLDIANESFALDEKILEKKLVRKFLRSLSKRFDMKVTTIEEAHDIRTTSVKLNKSQNQKQDVDNSSINSQNKYSFR